jgi:putative two-component system response regulator
MRVQSSLRLRILSLVVIFVCVLAGALANHLIDQFEESTRVGVMHEGLLISNLIESGVSKLAEQRDVPGIQDYLNRLAALRERNDIEMNVLFLRGSGSYIVASNVYDNIEGADPEEHAEMMAAIARRAPHIIIEKESGDVDPDDLASVGPEHPDFYFKAGHRLVNITTPLLVNGRPLGSVNVKLSLSDLDSDLEVIRRGVGFSMALAIVVLILGLVLYLDSVLFRPLISISDRLRQFGLGTRNFKTEWTDRRDEIGILAREFSHMVASLKIAEETDRQHQARLKRLVLDRTSELAATQEATILSMACLAEYRDPETGAHIKRTQNYVKALAEHLRGHPQFRDFFDDETIEMLFRSAPLHDIGKVGIADAILLKNSKLTDEEFEQMKLHPAYGRDAIMAAEHKLGTNSFLRFAREIAYSHHEKWDGTGYPEGLAGNAIPISGRLMAIADVYDALISRRCYKPPFAHSVAVGIIRDGRGGHFDPVMVDAFLEIEDVFRKIALAYAESEDERAAVSVALSAAAA